MAVWLEQQQQQALLVVTKRTMLTQPFVRVGIFVADYKEHVWQEDVQTNFELVALRKKFWVDHQKKREPKGLHQLQSKKQTLIDAHNAKNRTVKTSNRKVKRCLDHIVSVVDPIGLKVG